MYAIFSKDTTTLLTDENVQSESDHYNIPPIDYFGINYVLEICEKINMVVVQFMS